MSGLPQEAINKIAAYTGLAIRAGKAVIGTDGIFVRRIRLVLADPALSPNARKKLDARCLALRIPLIEIAELGKHISKPSCKAIGISEPNLAKAIINLTTDSMKENSNS
jgi:hypothetical protein